MALRPRPSSAPGPGRGRSGRRPAGTTPSTRRTTRATSGLSAGPATPSRSSLTGRAAILLLVLAVLAVSYASSMRAWLKQRSEINTLSAQISEREAAVAELELAKRRWHDDAFIRAQAKSRFAWVMPGETGYRVIGDDGTILSDGTSELSDPTAPVPTDDPQWWDTAWGSVVEAGRDPSAEAGDTATKPARTPADRIGGTKKTEHKKTEHKKTAGPGER